MKRTLGIHRSFLSFCTFTFTACCFLEAGCGSKYMPPPPPVVSVALTPVRSGVVTGQSITSTAMVKNDVGAAGVIWATSGGAFSTRSTTAARLTAPNATGNVMVTATSVADSTKSASATIAITDLTGVTTYHNDLARIPMSLR